MIPSIRLRQIRFVLVVTVWILANILSRPKSYMYIHNTYIHLNLTEYELMISRETMSTIIENANVKKVCFESRKSHEMECNWNENFICIMMMLVFNSWENSWWIGQQCYVNNEQAVKTQYVGGRTHDGCYSKYSYESYKNLLFWQMTSDQAFKELITNLIFLRFIELSSSQKHFTFFPTWIEPELYSVDSCLIHIFFSCLVLFHISVLGSIYFETKLKKAFFVGMRGRTVQKIDMCLLMIEFKIQNWHTK